MFATIAAIAEKKKEVQRSQRSYGNHSSAIVATTIAEKEKVLSQRSLLLRSLESGFQMIAVIAELFFFLSDRRDHMETGHSIRNIFISKLLGYVILKLHEKRYTD